MPIDPVAEDTHDKFTKMRRRISQPVKFEPFFGNKTHFTLGFIESGDSGDLYIHISTDAAEWHFFTELWILADEQSYRFELNALHSDTYISIGNEVRCQEQFTASQLDSELLKKLLAAPEWEIRLSGHDRIELKIEERSLGYWRAFYNAVIEPSAFAEPEAPPSPTARRPTGKQSSGTTASKTGCSLTIVALIVPIAAAIVSLA